jgi:hypothetical protein
MRIGPPREDTHSDSGERANATSVGRLPEAVIRVGLAVIAVSLVGAVFVIDHNLAKGESR